MNNKKGGIYLLLGIVCGTASIVMYQIGSNSSHLSELADYFYVPLPLAAVCLVVGVKKMNNL